MLGQTQHGVYDDADNVDLLLLHRYYGAAVSETSNEASNLDSNQDLQADSSSDISSNPHSDPDSNSTDLDSSSTSSHWGQGLVY